MTERGAATVGLAVAAAALLPAVAAWPGVGPADRITLLIGLAGGTIAFVAFSGVRHGAVSTRGGVVLAVIGGVCIIFAGVVGVIGAPAVETRRTLRAIAWLLLGAAAIGLANGMRTGVDLRTILQRASLLLFTGGIGLLALYVAGTTGYLVEAALGAISEPGILARFGARQVGVGIGFVAVAVVTVLAIEGNLEWIDLRLLNRSDVVTVVAGIVGIIAIAGAVTVVYWLLDVPTTEHAVHRMGQEAGPEVVLIAIPLTWIGAVIGEELVYRNVIQKYLTERWTASAAIIASSAIFAVVHLPAFTPGAPVELGAAVLAVFTISLVLAVAYHRTGNVVVPMIIHGIYNVIIYVGIYAQLAGLW